MSDADPARPCRAAIVGVGASELRDDERQLFEAQNPLGFILFARNCESPEQIRRLIGQMRAAVGRTDAPVLIDQEGGRVMRLRPPQWLWRPPLRAVGRLAERDLEAGRAAAWLHARLIAADLASLGIAVNCAPSLDLAHPERTEAIGDRAISADPELVAALGQAMIDGFLAGGVLPVIKHLPGHGRARVDSHVELPQVVAPRSELAADWLPFQRCRAAPFAMTAHVLYPDLDPVRPATLSATIVEDVIRGEIGFEGALLSDDLSMGALGGSLGERTAAALAAGCDVALHCNGRGDEMVEVLNAAGSLEGAAAARVEHAFGQLRRPESFEVAAEQARFDGLLDAAAPADRSVA